MTTRAKRGALRLQKRAAIAGLAAIVAAATAGFVLQTWTPAYHEASSENTQVSPPTSETARTAPTAAATDTPLITLVETLATDPMAVGLPRPMIERTLSGMTRDPEVVALSKAQPEFERTTGQYVEALVSAGRIADGRARLEQYADLLGRIENAYGVDRHVIVAIWGVESNYGAAQGDRNVIRSLATLLLEDQRRPELWKRELIAAMRILDKGDIDMAGMTGSWAGAMGHTQFMPTSFERLAVDFDGDGRRDIWHSPADALASTARYLKTSGWSDRAPAAIEVVLPSEFDYALTGRGQDHPAQVWRERGLKRPDGSELPATDAKQRLILPAGARGPAFLVSASFNAILRYNSAVPYALAVAHLADRLRGAEPIVRAWPSERGLNRSEREELQNRLVSLGYNAGGVDGMIGNLTRDAIRSYQKEAGLIADGHAGLELLGRLREATVAPNPMKQP